MQAGNKPQDPQEVLHPRQEAVARPDRAGERETCRPPEPEPPDMETLMAWVMEDSGCEAACPHGCWVEPDGQCAHGNPSWLLVLGLI